MVHVAQVIVEQVLGVKSAVTELAVVRVCVDDGHVVRHILVVVVDPGTMLVVTLMPVVRLSVVIVTLAMVVMPARVPAMVLLSVFSVVPAIVVRPV